MTDRELLIACACRSPETLEALRAASAHPIARAFGPNEDAELEGIDLLLLEESAAGPLATTHTRSFASVERDLLVAVIVPGPLSERAERALIEAGAVDVIPLGPELARALRRVIGFAQRSAALRDERARLASSAMHRDRISALGVLAAGVGHEINNPAGAILMIADQMRSEMESVLASPRAQQVELFQEHAPAWIDGLGDSIAAVRRITAIVRGLQVFSRRDEEAGRPVPINVNDEITTVLRMVGKELRYQTTVELDLDPDVPPVLAVPHAVTQVVTNLVINALQAMSALPTGQRVLHVASTHDSSGVLIEVRDSGPGISPEVLPKIFDPFFTTKGVGLGTGLGLSITRELVTRAGGEIVVESEVGRGARFLVVLPRAPDLRGPSRTSAPPATGARLRVLLVDDDEILLRALARTLEDEFECRTAASGEEALRLMRGEEPFDAAVIDIVMPGLDGLALHREIAKVDPNLAERTVFLSGGVRSDALEREIRATGRLLVAKPCRGRSLARAIREASVA